MNEDGLEKSDTERMLEEMGSTGSNGSTDEAETEFVRGSLVSLCLRTKDFPSRAFT